MKSLFEEMEKSMVSAAPFTVLTYVTPVKEHIMLTVIFGVSAYLFNSTALSPTGACPYFVCRVQVVLNHTRQKVKSVWIFRVKIINKNLSVSHVLQGKSFLSCVSDT